MNKRKPRSPKFATRESTVDQFRKMGLPAMEETAGEKATWPMSQTQFVGFLWKAGYFVNAKILRALELSQAFDPPRDGKFRCDHLLQVTVALGARRLWRPGFHNEKKSPVRRGREASGRAGEASVLTDAVVYDTALLLWMLVESDDRIDREAIGEILACRWRVAPPLEADKALKREERDIQCPALNN